MLYDVTTLNIDFSEQHVTSNLCLYMEQIDCELNRQYIFYPYSLYRRRQRRMHPEREGLVENGNGNRPNYGSGGSGKVLIDTVQVHQMWLHCRSAHMSLIYSVCV